MDRSRFHITDNVYVVGCGEWNGIRKLTAAGANVHLLDSGSELALIDVGMPESVPGLLRNIADAGFDVAKIKKVLLTHSHTDHVDGLSDVLKTLDCTVYGHALAKETLSGKQGIYAADFKHPGTPIAPVHEVVREGDAIRVGNVELRVIELPGHTPDGLGFVFDLPDGHGPACFTGDTAIGDQAHISGCIGWIDYSWNSKLTDFRASLKRIAGLKLNAIFPGHGLGIVGRDAVGISMDHCVARIEQFMAIPQLGSMFRIQI